MMMVSVWIFFAKLGFVVSTMASSVAPVASSVASASDNDEAANRHEAVVSSRKLQRAEVPPRPPGRYMAWSQLSDEKRTLATTLFGYANDGSDWNLPGTATFEVTSYSDLTPNQLQGVADVMGITGAFAEDIWDCWIAHYGDYFWSELATENVQQWYIALGWSEASWDFGTAAEPATEATDWVDLTEEEKEAARQLCFDQNMWDDVNLEIPMTDTPTVSPTTEMPTGEEYTRPPTTSPTTVPTSVPTATYVIPPYPPLRYTVFASLPLEVQNSLTSELLYTESSWNSPGANNVENLHWDQLSEAQRAVLSATNVDGGLEMTADVWNCYVNHYTAFFLWEQLNTKANARQFWEALGWTQESWSGFANPPDTEGKDWDELNQAEKDAATSLCYMKSTWDSESLLSFGTGAPTSAPSVTPPTAAPSVMPIDRSNAYLPSGRGSSIVAALVLALIGSVI